MIAGEALQRDADRVLSAFDFESVYIALHGGNLLRGAGQAIPPVFELRRIARETVQRALTQVPTSGVVELRRDGFRVTVMPHALRLVFELAEAKTECTCPDCACKR